MQCSAVSRTLTTSTNTISLSVYIFNVCFNDKIFYYNVYDINEEDYSAKILFLYKIY